MSTQATILIQSLGWALLHSLWQVLLIYSCLRVVLKVSGNTTARLRYHLSIAALAGSFVWFVSTCIAQYQRLQGVTIHITQSGSDPAATRSYALNALTTNAYDSSLLYNIMAGVEPYFPFLVSLYILGILLLLLKLTVNLVQVRILKTKGLSPADQYWADWVTRWADKLDISRKVQVFFSGRISVPMTMGTLKPVILLPLSVVNNLTTDQLEAILLHELAHIKRHDYFLNIIQTIVETILFFNPFVWLIARIIRKEREHCCDDLVVSYMNVPLPYVTALAELEANRQHTLALAASGNKHQLLNRIKRIMEMKKKPVNYTQFGIAAIVITALIVSIAWFSPAIAQTKKTVKKDKKGNTTVTTTKSTDESGTKSVTRTIVIESNKKGSNGVHPNDAGNAEDIRKQVKEALENADIDKVSDEVNKAMAEIDWQSIGKDVHIAMSKVDWDQAGEEVATALANVDWDEIEKEIKAAAKEMKEEDWEDVREKIKEARVQVKMSRDAMKADILKRRANIIASTTSGVSVNGHDFKEMLQQMEDDGLINRSKGYKVELEDGYLYINSKKQPSSVTGKYNNYFEDGSHTVIKGDKNNTTVNVNINR